MIECYGVKCRTARRAYRDIFIEVGFRGSAIESSQFMTGPKSSAERRVLSGRQAHAPPLSLWILSGLIRLRAVTSPCSKF